MWRCNLIISSFLIFLTLVVGKTQLKAQDGLIAHWTFDDVKDGKVKDISPNGHHATLEGKTKWIAKGAIGGALEFAGNGDYLQTPILDELKSPKNFTLSAWFQTNDTSEDEHHIIWVGSDGENGWGGGSELHLSVRHFGHPNKLSFYFGSGGESSGSEINIVTKEDFKDTSNWHHLVGVIKNANGPKVEGTLYLNGMVMEPWRKGFVDGDGNEFKTQDIADPPDRKPWNTKLRIGASGVLDQRFFDGKIDDVRIYNRAVTPKDITSAVEAGDKLTTTWAKVKKRH